MRILVAEDDLSSRLLLVAMLKKWGYDPVVAEDGGAAWEALQQPDAPRLVLLDWNMPVLEGPEVCRRLRRQATSDPPYVILLTGRGGKDDIVRGLDAGANDYLSKPYDGRELQARLRVGKRMLELQTRLGEARDALAFQAMHDPLTGVLNRRAILDRLVQETARAQREGGKGLRIGMCDIDHFKNINDTWGHQIGDEVLVAFTRCIQSRLRPYDCIGRYGGEEFLVIAVVSGEPAEEGLFERIRKWVADTEMDTPAGPVRVTVSIGEARWTDSLSADGLLAAADSALYQAKTGGRNRVVSAA